MTDEFVPEGDAKDEGAEVTGSVDDAPDLGAAVAELTGDLQRVQAEYVNYKRRVDRDRDVARLRGIESVIADLLPVLDGIDGAKAHDELTGGTKLIADEFAKVTAKYGLEPYGAVGDPFDPQIHEALMHVQVPGYSVTTCAQVFQTGYLLGGRVIRPARVAVTDPTEEPAETVDDSVPDDPGSLTN
ncbi:MAG TPA: nucleotide exchange factor GrpE [Propionibacteriaceae bacterium]